MEKKISVPNGVSHTRTITTVDVNEDGIETTSVQTIETTTTMRVTLDTKTRQLRFVRPSSRRMQGKTVEKAATPRTDPKFSKRPTEGPPPPPTALDMAVYPHIFDTIVLLAFPMALLKLRGTSKDVRDKVDDRLCRHIIIKHRHLRTRFGKIWLRHDDPRIKKAVILDLPKGGVDYGFTGAIAPQLHNLRLIRTVDFTADYSRGTPQCVSGLLTRKSKNMWLVTHADLTSQARDSSYHWRFGDNKISKIKSCCIHILYDPAHSRFPEVNLGGILPPDGKMLYVLFSPSSSSDTMWFNRMDRDLPPIKPRLLNSLLLRIVRPSSANICLVAVESWNHEWLNRKRNGVKEETAPDADMKTRLQWWICEITEKLPEQNRSQVSSITFLSLEQFRLRVPTEEVYRGIKEV